MSASDDDDDDVPQPMLVAPGTGTTSLLRPYNGTVDGPHIAVLVNSSTLSNAPLATSLFLVSPHVVSVFIGTVSAVLYSLYNLFTSTFMFPEELGQRQWQDYVQLVIYAAPPIAVILGILFGVGHWYHGRIWKRAARAEVESVDVRDVQGYYYPPANPATATSSFWVLQYDSQLVACFGLDARNPARQVQRFSDEESPRPALPPAEVEADPSKPSPAAIPTEGDSAEDVAFISSITKAKEENSASASDTWASTKPIFPASAYEALPQSFLPPSLISSLQEDSQSGTSTTSHIVHLRHFSVSPTFKTTNAAAGGMALDKISAYVLTLAVEAAFSASAGQAFSESKTAQAQPRIDRLLISLDPKLDKALRSAALDSGFRIVATTPAPKAMFAGRSGLKGFAEAALQQVWPLSFSQEYLLLDRMTWERNRALSR